MVNQRRETGWCGVNHPEGFFSCCLFNVKPPSSASSIFSHPEVGFRDNWKKLYEKVRSHEQYAVHNTNYRKWKDLLLSVEKQCGVDALRQQNIVEERNRWRQILRRLLEVTLFLAERNLPFRFQVQHWEIQTMDCFLELESC